MKANLVIFILLAGCVSVVDVPMTPCESDADCVVTSYEDWSCCASCDVFGATVTKEDTMERWRAENCKAALCPMFDCYNPHVEAICKDKECRICKGQGGLLFNNEECCEGFTKSQSFKPKGCELIKDRYVCIKCGDGSCGAGEDECNCAEDCKSAKCLKQGELIPNVGFMPPEAQENAITECCPGLAAIRAPAMFNEDCSFSGLMDVPSSICSDCGNGVCDDGENRCNCPEDCDCRDAKDGCGFGECCPGLKAVDFASYNGECIYADCGTICLPCGDGVCDDGENICNCPEDCKETVCGDGVCEGGESAYGCDPSNEVPNLCAGHIYCPEDCTAAVDECSSYRYSTCPEGCKAICTPSSCSGGYCTDDCDGPNSCVSA